MTTKDVQLYGEGKALKHMAWRVKHCVPNGNRLQDHEAMSLAQISLATGLNPFTGELWYIPGKGPMAGIRGLRRRAREQSSYSIDLRPMQNSELADHEVKPPDVGRICELFRHDVLQRAVEINKKAGGAIVPVKPVLGVGIWRDGDQIPSGKSATWVANKRAEADALRQAFDLTELPYSDEINGSQLKVADMSIEWSTAEEDETVRHEMALNAERYVQADVSPTVALDFDEVIAKYKSGELELPPWIHEIREMVSSHPKASDPVDNGSFINQLGISAGRKVAIEQFRAFVEIVLTHPLDEVTFGETAVLMNVINAEDFEAQVISLLS